MRIVSFDLSQDLQSYPKVFGGYVGEHNETQLEVKLPSRMLIEDISYYYFEFQTNLGEHINSLNIYKSAFKDSNTITCSLWEQLLQTEGILYFSVCAVKLEETSIVLRGKTMQCGLQISKSPNGKNAIYTSETSEDEIQNMINSALQTAKDSGAFKGEKGSKGDKGDKGDKGTSVSITDIKESNISGGNNVVTFNDGQSLIVKNGMQGVKGDKGDKGDKGERGEAGGAINVDLEYNPQSNNGQSGKAVAEALKDKLDTKKLSEKDQTNLYWDNIGLYAVANNGGSDVQKVFPANQSATENTIAVRLSNGGINCQFNDGTVWNGQAIPHTKFNNVVSLLNDNYNSVNTLASQNKTNLALLNDVVNAKKITVHQLDANDILKLKPNALYAFLKSGTSNTISVGLQNKGTKEFTIFNADTKDEVKMKFGVVIIPENTLGNSEAYPPSYYGVAAVDATTLGVTTVSSKKFTVKKSDLETNTIIAKADSSGQFLVWEISL